MGQPLELWPSITNKPLLLAISGLSFFLYSFVSLIKIMLQNKKRSRFIYPDGAEAISIKPDSEMTLSSSGSFCNSGRIINGGRTLSATEWQHMTEICGNSSHAAAKASLTVSGTNILVWSSVSNIVSSAAKNSRGETAEMYVPNFKKNATNLV